ncbi:hypothetical protein SEVIR_8G010851v4 [Setaria viridis]
MSTARYRQSCDARASLGTAPATPTNLEIASDSSVAISAASSSTILATFSIAAPESSSAPPDSDARRLRPPSDAAACRSTNAAMTRRTVSVFRTCSPAPSSATPIRSPTVAWSSTAATRSSRSRHVLAEASVVTAVWRRLQRNAAGMGASAAEGSTSTTDSRSARWSSLSRGSARTSASASSA